MSVNRVERRAYFRINDEIALSYSVLEGDEEQLRDVQGDMEVSLLGVMSNLDNEFNQLVNLLWRENATAAQALGLLNQKISLLAAHALQGEADAGLDYEHLTASISGCGMAFTAEEPGPVEARLRVEAILKPANVRVSFTADVVACERVSDIPSARYLLRIAIDKECEDAREQLVQHVVQRQFTSSDQSVIAS